MYVTWSMMYQMPILDFCYADIFLEYHLLFCPIQILSEAVHDSHSYEEIRLLVRRVRTYYVAFG